MKKKCLFLLVVCLLFTSFSVADQKSISFDSYHTPEDVNKILKDFAAKSKIARLHKIAQTAGGKELLVLEVGPEVGKKNKKYPAIFIAANMEGKVPISTEAALYLAKMVLSKGEVRKDKTWYFLANGNPDAAYSYFRKPLRENTRNAAPYNDDMDDAIDEDGAEDLDKNGVITMMRVKDPQGTWVPVAGETRLLKKADGIKGEKGIYKLYVEGIDNDRDGKYNEDGPGGVNIGINFPHLFKHFTKSGGAWAGSELESFNLIKFITEHKEIAFIFTFGDTDFCQVPPRGGRKGSADFAKIKIPKRFGKFLNVDTDRTYTMKEVIEIAKRFVPEGMDVSESMIASFFGLGAVVNPIPADLKFYTHLSEKYKEYLKKNKMDDKRLETARAKDGSFELWAYYHLGLPSFSMALWTPPQLKEEKKKESSINAEKLAKMSGDEFVALGEEKIDAFLKSSGAPKNVKAKMLINAVKGGMMTPKKMAEMMKTMPKPKSKEGADPKEKALLAHSDKRLKGSGFINWKAYQHPTLGKVEIGGFVPFTGSTPPATEIEKQLKVKVPWIFQLTDKLPRIKIQKVKVKTLGSGLYLVKAWIENEGYLPYPTAMGVRNNRIQPIVLTFSGSKHKIIEGKKRTLIKQIPGHGVKMVKWILKVETPGSLTLKAHSPSIWDTQRQVKLGGEK